MIGTADSGRRTLEGRSSSAHLRGGILCDVKSWAAFAVVPSEALSWSVGVSWFIHEYPSSYLAAPGGKLGECLGAPVSGVCVSWQDAYWWQVRRGSGAWHVVWQLKQCATVASSIVGTRDGQLLLRVVSRW